MSQSSNNFTASFAPSFKIFCDFDGAIVHEDVGCAFFETFGGHEIWNDIMLYEEGNIGAQELYRREASRITSISEDQIDAFCLQFEIDPSFIPFADWCKSNSFFLTVISDGMDVYVHRILHRYNVHVPIYCNTLHITADGGVIPEFPYTDEESSDCANCKRNHLLTLSSDEDIIAMIGDGYSDRCPSRYADIIFAKGSLIPYCQKENLTFNTFDTFTDIQKIIESLIRNKRFRKPKQAQLRRRAIWMRG